MRTFLVQFDEKRRANKAARENDGTQAIKKQTDCGRIYDAFRSGDGPKIWKTVVVPVYKGLYRLNLTPKNLQSYRERDVFRSNGGTSEFAACLR
jgi:hypothetical protein